MQGEEGKGIIGENIMVSMQLWGKLEQRSHAWSEDLSDS